MTLALDRLPGTAILPATTESIHRRSKQSFVALTYCGGVANARRMHLDRSLVRSQIVAKHFYNALLRLVSALGSTGIARCSHEALTDCRHVTYAANPAQYIFESSKPHTESPLPRASMLTVLCFTVLERDLTNASNVVVPSQTVAHLLATAVCSESGMS